ncbi:uncharacterized protein [Leptinotarsa decemlineata]|uniref:uncharacterized protein n=1 Tax=Leptinotarsa decemlineata TaxID=7539 RepID=UPI003D305A64
MNLHSSLSTGWAARGGASEVVRRAHPASGAQWNVQVVRGKVNGRCLWNACKALSLGLLLMVLGAAMATIGYYADHLSVAKEVKGNYTIRAKNETKSFHLNNLSYAGPIVMGVGGFIVVAACVMTFEARDSAAKVVPARFKLSTTVPPPNACQHVSHGTYSRHSSLKTAGSQTTQYAHCHSSTADRRAMTQSFMHFSRGLVLEAQPKKISLKVPQGSINRSPSAPDLILERSGVEVPTNTPVSNLTPIPVKSTTKPRTFAACALLNPGLLHRHALSVDETGGNFRLSNESLHPSGSQGSMVMDLHLDCPVTLRVKDRRRNPLKRQRRVDEELNQNNENGCRRSSHSCSVRMQTHSLKETSKGGSAQQLSSQYSHCPKRRSSNASDCTHRSRPRRRECQHSRGQLERAISSDSRLTGAIPKCYHQHTPQQDVGETAKEGLESGVETVKATMHTAVEATENGVGTVLGKIGDTLNFTSSAAKDAAEDLEHKKDELVTNAYDTAAEVVSETETILASETESAKEAFTSKSAPIFETVRSFENEIESKTEKLQDNLVGALDDVESDIEQHFDALGDNVKAAEKKVEERLDISLPGSPEKEPKKEE